MLCSWSHWAGGPAADGAGAGGVPDLGQVPQRDPGIVAAGLVPVRAVVTGSRVMIRSGPGPGVRSRQLPYPPGGPSRLAGVTENPVSPGGPGPARCRRLRDSGRAQPWATAWPWPSVTVRHQVVPGWPRRRRPGRGSARGRPGRGRQARRACQPGGSRWPAGRSG